MNAPRCLLCGSHEHVLHPAPRVGRPRCDLCGDMIADVSSARFVVVEAEHASGEAHAACFALGEEFGFDRDRIEASLSAIPERDLAALTANLPPVEQFRASELWARRQGVRR